MDGLKVLVWVVGITIGVYIRDKRKKDAELFRRDNNLTNCCKRNEECRLTYYKWR